VRGKIERHLGKTRGQQMMAIGFVASLTDEELSGFSNDTFAVACGEK